jgi:endogenous inhibitor of DNA gyrase (YacG/DUF329 family)
MSENVTRLRPRAKCPECGKSAATGTYPFCSDRCKDLDLNRWLKGSYVLPGRPITEEDSDEA